MEDRQMSPTPSPIQLRNSYKLPNERGAGMATCALEGSTAQRDSPALHPTSIPYLPLVGMGYLDRVGPSRPAGRHFEVHE